MNRNGRERVLPSSYPANKKQYEKYPHLIVDGLLPPLAVQNEPNVFCQKRERWNWGKVGSVQIQALKDGLSDSEGRFIVCRIHEIVSLCFWACVSHHRGGNRRGPENRSRVVSQPQYMERLIKKPPGAMVG